MSDLDGLHGIYPNSLRWNAEEGFLAVSSYNAETGERELQQIELGKDAVFVLDLLTRERGYGNIKVGLYSMILSPVGSPLPAWPGDDDYKPAIGCWVWHPTYGGLRLETNAKIFREAIVAIWDLARFEPQAAEGLQPVICFAGLVKVVVKAVKKDFLGPLIKIVGWVPRDQVPGWGQREATVALPTTPTLLTAPSTAVEGSEPATKPLKAKASKAKASKKPEIDDGLDGVLDGDPIPYA